MRRVGWLVCTAMLMTMLAACGGDEGSSGAPDSPSASEPAPETTTADAGSSDTTLPPGATPGHDDLNQDGMPDPICSSGDYGAGLVLKIPCNAPDYAPDAPAGTTVIPSSVFALPALQQRELLSEASAEAIQARDPNGKLVVVLFIQSDTLFELGSSALSDPARDTLNGLARSIQRAWPTSAVQVRGHTDATGSASVNQTLSQQRASNVAAYLATQGISQSRLSSVGLSSTHPIVLEKYADGSDNAAGRTINRRVELVVRVP